MSLIRIWVGNLAKYNEGKLVGEWLALPADDDTIEALYERIGIGDPDEGFDEEIFIADYEADAALGEIRIGEYDSIDDLNDIAERLEALSDDELEVFAAVVWDYLGKYEEALGVVEKGSYRFYPGCDSMRDVAYDVVEDGFSEVLMDLPDIIRCNIDYGGIAVWLSSEATYLKTKTGYVEVW